MNRCSCIDSLTYKHTTAIATRLRRSIMETMRRALSQLAKEIEELKFKYIEAERSNNLDKMELILNELDILEAYYNHQVAILNGDADNHAGSSQEDIFIRTIQNDSFNTPPSSVSNSAEFDGFSAKWKKLIETLGAKKKAESGTVGLCHICMCDVDASELFSLPCGHTLCLGECGARLPSPFCPAGGCNKNIEQVFETDDGKKKRKAEEDISLDARMRDLHARGFVAAPAPVVAPSVVPSLPPDIIVIDDSDDDDEVVFISSRNV